MVQLERVRSLGFGLSSLVLDLDFEKRDLLASWSFSSLIFKLELIFPFFFFFLMHCEAYGILVPQLGIKPWAFHNEPQSPNHWIAREFPIISVTVKNLK